MIFAVLYFEVVKPAAILSYQLALLSSLILFNILVGMITPFTSIIREFSHAFGILGE